MSTKYFILSKNPEESLNINENNKIIHIENINYILPLNLINCYTKNGLFECSLIEWSKQFCSKDKTFLDIGAHTGTYSLPLSYISKNVYSFEPQKMTYYALCGSVALSNIQNINCLKLGLGSKDQEGEQNLNIISDDGGGSSLHRNNSNILKTERIKIITLDSLNLYNIGFIKMDVEDNEYFVILGGLETLKRSNYPHILFECNDAIKNKKLFEILEPFYKCIKVTGVSNMYLAVKN